MDSPSIDCLRTLSLLPTRLSSGVLPGFFRKWYIFDTLLLLGRYSSSSFACRVCERGSLTSGSDIARLLTPTGPAVLEGSRWWKEGECCGGGDWGRGGSATPSIPMSPPKEDRSMPSRFIGLLLGSGEASGLASGGGGRRELMVSSVGLLLEARGMAAAVYGDRCGRDGPGCAPCVVRYCRERDGARLGRVDSAAYQALSTRSAVGCGMRCSGLLMRHMCQQLSQQQSGQTLCEVLYLTTLYPSCAACTAQATPWTWLPRFPSHSAIQCPKAGGGRLQCTDLALGRAQGAVLQYRLSHRE